MSLQQLDGYALLVFSLGCTSGK